MSRSRIARRIALSVAILLCAASALPLASPAATAKGTKPEAPHVATGEVSHVSGTSATLEGSVNPHNLATTYYFQYGPTVAYGAQTTPAGLAAGAATIKVSRSVTGLQPGYHYRLVATNTDGTKFGHDRTFTTKKKKEEAGFTLPKSFAPTPLGGVFILSGTLTGPGNANRAIVLQASPYPYSAPFADVGSPIVTNAAGRFSFRVANLSTSTRFRVSTLGSAPVHSLIVPAQVAVRVALKVRSSSHKGLVRLYGTVTPAEVGAHVFFQLETPPKTEKTVKSEKPAKLEKPGKPGKSGQSGKSEKAEERAEAPKFSTKFSTVVKRGTKTISRFSAVVNVRDSGHYRAFVEIRPGPFVSGHSQSVLLHAPAKKTGTKKTGKHKG